jgi:hypothetical protein
MGMEDKKRVLGGSNQ